MEAALSVALLLMASFAPISKSQITTPCTPAMITSFTPCMNFITGSSGNGTSPTTQCCGTLRSLLGTSLDCACLIITAGVPVQLPINRTLAISLPRACKISGVPVRCKGTAAPLPAPGPVSDGPASSVPTASSIPESTTPSLAPRSDTEELTPAPASPPVGSDTLVPNTNTGVRPVLTPNAASNKPSQIWSPVLLFVLSLLMVSN